MSQSVAPSKDPERQVRVIEFLSDRLEESSSYVKSSLAADRLDEDSKVLAKTFILLEEKGYLETWTEASSYTLYRITEKVHEDVTVEEIADD